MTIPTEVAAVLAEMRSSPSPDWKRNNILDDWADRIESALTAKAEAVEPVAWQSRYRHPLPNGGFAKWQAISKSEFDSFNATPYESPYETRALYANAPPAVPVESLGRDAKPACGLDDALLGRGLPTVNDALGYSRNFAAANPNLTQTTKDHITGLCDMLELAATHLAPPPASVPDRVSGIRLVAKRNLRSLIKRGSTDKDLMLKCLEELS